MIRGRGRNILSLRLSAWSEVFRHKNCLRMGENYFTPLDPLEEPLTLRLTHSLMKYSYPVTPSRLAHHCRFYLPTTTCADDRTSSVQKLAFSAERLWRKPLTVPNPSSCVCPSPIEHGSTFRCRREPEEICRGGYSAGGGPGAQLPCSQGNAMHPYLFR